MPPVYLFDLSQIDLNGEPLFNKEAICRANPQRFEMQQLDGILWLDKDQHFILGYKDVTDQEFWVRGHIPGRPLMPGVIMVEASAQLLSFYVRQLKLNDSFLGFGGIESAKFRATVEPGQRLYLLGHVHTQRSRKYICAVQGIVDEKLVYEATIIGMRV